MRRFSGSGHMLRTWLHAVAGAAGLRSPVCGHWKGELADGLCFDCVMERIERRTWKRIEEGFIRAVTERPELFKDSTERPQ